MILSKSSNLAETSNTTGRRRAALIKVNQHFKYFAALDINVRLCLRSIRRMINCLFIYSHRDDGENAIFYLKLMRSQITNYKIEQNNEGQNNAS